MNCNWDVKEQDQGLQLLFLSPVLLQEFMTPSQLGQAWVSGARERDAVLAALFQD
jgi:hypothetical protein